jgi:hypothetical protein
MLLSNASEILLYFFKLVDNIEEELKIEYPQNGGQMAIRAFGRFWRLWMVSTISFARNGRQGVSPPLEVLSSR